MLNFMLLVLILCLAAFFLNIYFQLSRIETSLNKLLENVEAYLLKTYGEE